MRNLVRIQIFYVIFHLSKLTAALLKCPSVGSKECACKSGTKQNEIVVDCSNLELNEIPHDIPASTTHLDVSGNSLKTFTNKTFSSLRHLKILDASNNLLQKLDVDTFKLTSKLQSLNLARNQLKWNNSFPAGLFKPIQESLLHLDISQNLDNLNATYPDEALADLTKLQVLKMDCLSGKTFHPWLADLAAPVGSPKVTDTPTNPYC